LESVSQPGLHLRHWLYTNNLLVPSTDIFGLRVIGLMVMVDISGFRVFGFVLRRLDIYGRRLIGHFPTVCIYITGDTGGLMSVSMEESTMDMVTAVMVLEAEDGKPGHSGIIQPL
jgi:hypothetical protein